MNNNNNKYNNNNDNDNDNDNDNGLAEAVNRTNLTFAVSSKYLSNETKIHIFITRIPRGVYIIFLGFFKNVVFPTSG